MAMTMAKSITMTIAKFNVNSNEKKTITSLIYSNASS
ncbi:hypothetical protein C8C85_2616 [Flavobacterium sp. 103]|nr:hypothetical protein C8C85_2616 [Flavobacterium sp. 103]